MKKPTTLESMAGPHKPQHIRISHKQQILKHLQASSRGMTSFDAINQYSCTRLAHYIYALRNEGYNILTIDEPNSERRGTHARYILISEPEKTKSEGFLCRQGVLL